MKENVSIVKFVENVMEIQLTDEMKIFTEKAYEAIKYNKVMVYTPARGGSKFLLNIIYALVTIRVAQEHGLIKKEKI